jgi:hypothetical protein
MRLQELAKARRLQYKEWILKFVSICLAVLLWSFVGGEDIVEKNVMVPVEVINMPKNLIISNKFKKDIAVTVKGPRSLLMEMEKRVITRQIDLSDATPGTKVIAIENESVNVSRNVEVLRVQPSSIILSLDKLIQKEFAINPVTSGMITQGFVLESLTLDPDVITFTGPQTVLSRVDVLKTTPININGLFESVQQQIPLDLEPAIVDLIGETSVTASIKIAFDMVEKTFKNLPVNVTFDGAPVEVVPEKVSVTMKIPKMIIKKKMDFTSLFSVTAVEEEGDDGEMKVQIIPGKDLTVPLEVVEIEPPYVQRVQESIEEDAVTNQGKRTH